VFGIDPRTQERYVQTSFDYDGSGGAVAGYDGYPGISTLTALGAVTRGNVEEMEIRIPWRMLKYEFTPDLMGAGKWRGGGGVHWEAINEGLEAGIATGSSDGDETFGPGALGGRPCPPCRTYVHRGQEEIRLKPHRLIQIQPKDIIVKISSGGAGVGKPEERDPELVRKDVRNGLVSVQCAREIYKVAIHPETFEIDREQTRALRGQR